MSKEFYEAKSVPYFHYFLIMLYYTGLLTLAQWGQTYLTIVSLIHNNFCLCCIALSLETGQKVDKVCLSFQREQYKKVV